MKEGANEMGDYEDAVERLREEGLDDLAETFEGYGAKALRAKASKSDELQKELDAAQARIKTLERAPQVEKAFRDKGVDFDQLRPAELEALKAVEAEELTDEVLSGVITKYQLPLVEGSGETEGDEEEIGAEGVVQAARSAPTKGSQSAVIKAEDANGWPIDKLMRFRQAHPEEFEALKRGETVTGVAFS